MGNAGSAPEQAKSSAEGGSPAEAGRAPPSTVHFFPDAERHKARQPPPIKLEEEEEGAPPPPATEEEMAPRNLWQVYALGAFIVLRWAWAKWKENQDRKDSPDGDAPDGSTPS